MLTVSPDHRGIPPGVSTAALKTRSAGKAKSPRNPKWPGRARTRPARAAGRTGRVPRSAALVALEKLALKALEDMKAVNIRLLDVRGLTDVADTMIVASGTSDQHVRAIAENVIVEAKAAGRRPLGTEGRQDGGWVRVDLQDLLVHVMLPRGREFYGLEQPR